MKKLNLGSLLTSEHTQVYHDEPEFNAPHNFIVKDNDGKVLTEVNFQKGPIKECGINGIHNEDLLCMVLARLNGFQNSAYVCKENQMAVDRIEEALLWLRKRTNDRNVRGVEGTHKV